MSLLVTDITVEKPREPDWRWVFLEILAKTCCVSSACIAANVSRLTAYRHRDRFPRFRKRWDEALEVGVEVLEVAARHRALNPADPASHILLMFLLKAHRPHKYRDNGHTIPVADDTDEAPALTAADFASLSADDLNALESIAAKIAGGPGQAPEDDPGRAGAPVAD